MGKSCEVWHLCHIVTPMKLLFITASRIGDAVLSAGLLEYMAQQYPDAKITVVCGPLATSLFEGAPNVERIIPLRKEKHHRHWMRLWKDVIRTKWHIVVDLRNTAVSRMIMANNRHIFGPHIDKNAHKVEQNAAVMKLDKIPYPRLHFTEEQEQKARTLIPDGGPVMGVGPTANWIGKTWPADRFIEVVSYLTAKDGPMEDARVAVFAAPGEEEAAEKVLASIPKDKQLDLIAKTDPGTAAAALERCNFYIGNDSGLMHCAAACGVPTLGLFGPSYPHLYRPWGENADYIATPESFDELIDFDDYSPQTCGCLMESLTVDAVKAKLDDFWKNRIAA